MINISNLDNKVALITEWLSYALEGVAGAIEYEIQDGGKFILFCALNLSRLISEKKFRAFIYSEVAGRFKDIDAQWMLVFLDGKGDVIDEIDSIIGVDY